MENWKKLSVVELKRLIKSRFGRIAELEIEVGILNVLVAKKIEAGDLSDCKPIKQKKSVTKPIEERQKRDKGDSSNLEELAL